jgi:hypothetical protein
MKISDFSASKNELEIAAKLNLDIGTVFIQGVINTVNFAVSRTLRGLHFFAPNAALH